MTKNIILEEELQLARVNLEEQKKLFIEKSKNDDKYIKALKTEVQKLKDGEFKDLRLSSASLNGEHLQPLKTDYVKKITALEKEVDKWKQECKRLQQGSMVNLGKVRSKE